MKHVNIIQRLCLLGFPGSSEIKRLIFSTVCVCSCLCVCSFLCPDLKFTDTGNVLMSPEQCVFGYGSIDLLAGDEEDEGFSP